MSGFLYDSWMILAALLPSIGLLFLFWVILKHIVEGDRRERAALRAERAQREAALKESARPGTDAAESADGVEPDNR